jgi:hypothetical protein
MGNIAGSEVARAAALSDKELKAKYKLDAEYSVVDK